MEVGQERLIGSQERRMVRAGAGSSARCLLEYVKVAFFRAASLRPVPPAESEQKDVRTLDIHEDGRVDEAQFSAWVSKRAFCPANECERAMRGAPRGVSGRQIICLASPTKAAAKAPQAHYAFRSGGQTKSARFWPTAAGLLLRKKVQEAAITVLC